MTPDTACRPHRDRVAAPRGFTVTELLVVIAIIALLVALLLAGLSAAQNRAKAAATDATMGAFATAAQAFQQEHGQFPGVVPEDILVSDASGGVPQISSTENALLHLLGGYVIEGTVSSADYMAYGTVGDPGVLEFDFNGGAFTLKVNINRIGEGPRINGKQFQPYFTPSDDTLLSVNGDLNNGISGGTADPLSDLPDLVDAWGQPILFMRQARGLGPIMAGPGDLPSGTAAQFFADGLRPYTDATDLGRLGNNQTLSGNDAGSILTGLGNDPVAHVNLGFLMRQPALPDAARGSFVLISAGRDGIYFSAEDGPGTQSDPVIDLEMADLPGDIADEYDDLLRFGGA